MTVSLPFSAPAWPPDTGASRKPMPRCLRRSVKLAGNVRRGGGVIDEDRALLHARECAVRPNRHLAQIIVVADAGEDEVGIARGLRRSVRGRAADSATQASARLRVRL